MAKVCLIDAHSLFYRAFFAIRTGLSTSYGQPTNAIYGFINMLNRIIKEVQPQYLGICLDVAKPTFREKKFKEYKIHRAPMPQDLVSQIPYIKEIIEAYNIPMIEKEGFEADDVIATLASKAKKNGYHVVIVTSDKDMLQLVDKDVSVYNPYKENGTIFTTKKVMEKFGIQPQQIPDLLALMGDSVDNIPGAKGIGEKTAVGLIKEFKQINNLLQNYKKIKSDKVKDIIQNNKETIELSRELAVLPLDLDVEFDKDGLEVEDIDYQKLYDIFKKLEFKSLLNNISDKIPAGSFDQESLRDEEIKAITLTKESLTKELKNHELFSFFPFEDQKGLKVYFSSGEDNVFLLKDKNTLKSFFQDKQIKKIGHDFKAVKLLLDRYGLVLEGEDFDIMIAAYLIDPAKQEYNVSALAYDHLNTISLPQDSSKKIPLLIYNLKEIFKKELKDRELIDLFRNLEMPLIDVLFKLEKNGIKVDIKLLKDFSKKFDSLLKKLISDIFDIAGQEFNINSPKQLRKILFDNLKLPVVKRTKTGPSTDEEVLRKLSASHKLPALILEYRQITKLKTTYVDVLPTLCTKKECRVHSTFLQTGTETGRLSSANPNLQNIPIKTELGRQIRGAFVSSGSDWLLLSADYSQIELRILAHLSKDDALIESFKKDLDIHRMTASLIYQVDIKDVQDQMRETAKRINFGIIYGMSAYGLAKDLNVEVGIAQEFIDSYFLRYPGVSEFVQDQFRFARDNGFVSTILGRRRYLPNINSPNNNLRQFNERQAINAPIQGSAADLIKLAMVNVQKELEKNNFESKMILQVHDELVFDFPKKEKDKLLPIVKKGMEGAFSLDIPVKVSMKIGRNWAEMEDVG